MTTGTARRIRLIVALAAAAGARWAVAAPPGVSAAPEVGVVQTAANGSGSGMIVLRNDGSALVVAGGVAAEPGCDPAVHASPLGGFTLAAGGTQPLSIACTPAPAGIRRCSYTVRSTSGTVLTELEAVCASAGSPSLVPDMTAVDFGSVMIGASAARTIALHNTGAAAISKLFVDTTELAGNFTAAAPCNPDARECDAAIPSVGPGGTINLTVACTPRTVGPQSAQLYVVTDAGTRLAAPIALACTGAAATAPVISVSPSPIDVGAVELVNATATATVHVSNAGTDMLRLLDIQIVDAGTGAAADWTYSALAPCNSHIPPVCDLAAAPLVDHTVDLDLVFDPSAIGVRDATLLINYHDTADRSISVPLRGVGRGATLELVGRQAALDFGTLPLNATGVLTLQVANHGTRDLTDGVLAVMPPGPFTASPGPDFTVAAGARTMVTVTCKPTAPAATANLQLSAPDVETAPIAVTLRCAGDPAMVLTASPPAVLLGEVRLASRISATISVMSTSGPIGQAALETPTPGMMLGGTPAAIALTVTPHTEGSLANRILVPASSGPELAIATTGAAVTAGYSVPVAVSLGTFCVEQPTTPRILPLASTGTATIAVMAPALQRSDSPFDLQFVAPQLYPATLAPLQSALVAATPRRQTTAGLVTDDLIWTTDVAEIPTARTTLTATFIDNGGAIAPDGIVFDRALIHIETRNARQVTLRNCDVSPLQLDPPVIPAPFTIDSPNFPTALLPGETATFSVGFHPTKVGSTMKLLSITSPQLTMPLTVTLTGCGVVDGGDCGAVVGGEGDAGTTTPGRQRTSFYACSSCASNDASGALVFVVAALCAVVPRRRRR